MNKEAIKEKLKKTDRIALSSAFVALGGIILVHVIESIKGDTTPVESII